MSNIKRSKKRKKKKENLYINFINKNLFTTYETYRVKERFITLFKRMSPTPDINGLSFRLVFIASFNSPVTRKTN